MRFYLIIRVYTELPQVFGALLNTKELNPIKVHSDPLARVWKHPDWD